MYECSKNDKCSLSRSWLLHTWDSFEKIQLEILNSLSFIAFWVAGVLVLFYLYLTYFNIFLHTASWKITKKTSVVCITINEHSASYTYG